jgi:hypothetical protein
MIMLKDHIDLFVFFLYCYIFICLVLTEGSTAALISGDLWQQQWPDVIFKFHIHHFLIICYL